MDQGQPDSKRPRLFGSHAGIELLHPPTTTPSPAHTTGALPQHPAPPTGQYHPHHPPPHHFRPSEPHPSSHSHPPPQPQPRHPPPHTSIPHPPPHPPPPPVPNHIEDRRHHEPDRYPPMQEHRQPPPSPAHPPYPYMRDPMVKPDPGDDTLSHVRRPHSTGNAPEPLPGTPHPGLPLPSHPGAPQAPPEDRRHMSYDAAPQPSLYRQASYPAPPQTPIAHGTPYEYTPSYGPSHHEMAQYAIPIAASGKRKAQRASQACDSCRQLKAKCDETKPCKSCKEKKLECKYRDPAPKVQDKVSADILDAIGDLRGLVEQNMSQWLHVVRVQHKMAEKMNLPMETLLEDDDHRRTVSGVTDGTLSFSPGNVTNSTEMDVEVPQQAALKVEAEVVAPIAASQARDRLRELVMDEEQDEEPPGPHVAPGQPAIPLNHTTLASMLLKWKAIKHLVQHHLAREGINYVDEFPIHQEEKRGLLRLFGRGEGRGIGIGDRESSVDQGSWEGFDDYSETSAPSPADCWGTIGGLTPPVARDSRGAVIAPLLDFNDTTVWKFVHSYEENIQNMHPLISPKYLYAMVKVFLDKVHRTPAKRPSKHAGYLADQSFPQYGDTGTKRKRSPGVDDLDTPPGVSPVSSKPGKPPIERSIQSALVLLVLALGKICLWRDKIPEVLPVSEPMQGSPVMRNGHPLSPIQGSPPAYAPMPLSSALPSPKDFSRSRRGSFQSGTAALPKSVPFAKRNMDVIPGLDYFATATDILGGQLAGSTMLHIYANILAGLYHGQLGRVLESYAYIRQAGLTLQSKLRPALDRLSKSIKSVRDNQLVYAFWSCLQLESDIIAELPVPQSGILAYEENMPNPDANLAIQQGFDERVLFSFSAQLYLRKEALNKIHQLLYDPSKPQQGPLPPLSANGEFGIFSAIDGILDMKFVPAQFKFDLKDPPAADILSARLRAKYWGARVILFRPFIRAVMLSNENGNALHSPSPISGDFRSDIALPGIGPDATRGSGVDPQVIEHAGKGVEALIQSTMAFHGLGPQRFIITNVFGTAHAQWGNLLVLSAAYKDPVLNAFIPEATLRELLSKTISFFKLVAHSTSALSVDLRILQGLERDLFYPNSDIAGPNSSFSSTKTNETVTLAPMVYSSPGAMQAPAGPRDGFHAPPPHLLHPPS